MWRRVRAPFPNARSARPSKSRAANLAAPIVTAWLRQRVADAAALLREEHNVTPGLAAVLVGDDPASQVYVRSKGRACTEAGIASFEFSLPGDADLAAILDLVGRLNADERVD